VNGYWVDNPHSVSLFYIFIKGKRMKVTVDATSLKLLVDLADTQSWEVRKNVDDEFFTNEQRVKILAIDLTIREFRKKIEDCGL
jgi:hypothetical protein